jgi:hypothetical protein
MQRDNPSRTARPATHCMGRLRHPVRLGARSRWPFHADARARPCRRHLATGPRFAGRHRISRRAAGDGMEDLVEDGITCRAGSGMLDQRQCEPLTHDRQMAHAEQAQRRVGHGLDILRDQGRIIVRAGSIRCSNQNQQRAQGLSLAIVTCELAMAPCSKASTPGGMVTQGSFDLTQMCLLTVNQLGSSKVPPAMVLTRGRSWAMWDTVVPHCGQ